MSGKLLNSIRRMYINSSPCVKEKWDDCGIFFIELMVKFRHVFLAFQYVHGMKEMKMRMRVKTICFLVCMSLP